MKSNEFFGISGLIAQLKVSREVAKTSLYQFEHFQLVNSQAVYVVSYKAERITLQKGIKELLGYDCKDFQFDNLSQLIHPDDREMVCNISMSAIKNALKFGLDYSDRLYLSFRMRHLNGRYVYVERTSGINAMSESGEVLSTFSILRVPSFIPLNSLVKYNWKSVYSGLDEIRQDMEWQEPKVLTKRELEILELLSKGYNYKFISKRLFISSETVRSHRKKMIRKLGLTDVNGLVRYYHNLKG